MRLGGDEPVAPLPRAAQSTDNHMSYTLAEGAETAPKPSSHRAISVQATKSIVLRTQRLILRHEAPEPFLEARHGSDLLVLRKITKGKKLGTWQRRRQAQRDRGANQTETETVPCLELVFNELQS